MVLTASNSQNAQGEFHGVFGSPFDETRPIIFLPSPLIPAANQPRLSEQPVFYPWLTLVSMRPRKRGRGAFPFNSFPSTG